MKEVNIWELYDFLNIYEWNIENDNNINVNSNDISNFFENNYIIKYDSKNEDLKNFFIKWWFLKKEWYDVIYINESLILYYIVSVKKLNISDQILDEYLESIWWLLVNYIINNILWSKRVTLILDYSNKSMYNNYSFLLKISENTKNILKEKENKNIYINTLIFLDKEIKLKEDVKVFLNKNKYYYLDFDNIIINYVYLLLKDDYIKEKEKNYLELYWVKNLTIWKYIVFKIEKLKKINFKSSKAKNIINKYWEKEWKEIIDLFILNDFFKKEGIWNIFDEWITIEKLEDIKNKIKSKLIWQDSNIDSFFDSFKMYVLWWDKYKKPFSTLITWPTWVWKTYFAKLLARYLWWYFHREDMATMWHEQDTSKLLWSPAWYVWYWEETIVDKLKKYNHSILLFDEIEKAHKSVNTILLSLLDDWILTDSKNDVLYMKWWHIIIFTSNVIRSYEEFRPMFLEDVDNKEEVDWTNLLFDNFYDY